MADSSKNAQSPAPMEGRDEVDFIVAKHNNNNEYGDLRSVSQAVIPNTKAPATVTVATATATTTTEASAATATATPNNEPNSNTLKKSKERRTLFHFGSSSKKLSQSKSQDEAETTPTSTAVAPLPPVPIGTPPRQHKFVKSNSLARLLGNTYNAKKFEKQEQKRLASGSEGGKFNTYSGRRGRAGPYLERFKRVSKEDGDIAGGDDSVRVTNVITLTTDSRDLLYGSRQEHVGRTAGHEQPDQLSSKAIRTLTRSLGKLWKRTHSVDISTPDPEFKVSYLGNVLTGWAKGESDVRVTVTNFN